MRETTNNDAQAHLSACILVLAIALHKESESKFLYKVCDPHSTAMKFCKKRLGVRSHSVELCSSHSTLLQSKGFYGYWLEWGGDRTKMLLYLRGACGSQALYAGLTDTHLCDRISEYVIYFARILPRT